MATTLLDENCSQKVGNGKKLNASTTKWAQGQISIFQDSISIMEPSQLKVTHLVLPHNKGWHIQRINKLFELFSARVIKSMELHTNLFLQDSQYGLYLSPANTQPNRGTTFQSKNNKTICSMNTPNDIRFFRILFSSQINPKWKLFVWKLWHNSIATKHNLFRRTISLCDTCPLSPFC